MGVLDGIKILELARVPPAEMPGMMLADMGADVLKIETPEPSQAHDAQWVRRTIHAFVNRNKRSMALNMKAPEGQEIFRRLAKSADVIVEGFRPGVMDRLGAGYETLRPLESFERELWPVMLRRAALRTWLGRLGYNYFPRDSHMTIPKDHEFSRRLLEHHVAHARSLEDTLA